MTFPFATAATSSYSLADSLNGFVGGITMSEGQGASADAINLRIANADALFSSLAESALTLSGICGSQDDGDVLLSNAPTPQEVKDAWREWKRVLREHGDGDEADDARDRWAEKKATREAAVEAHKGTCEASGGSLDGLDIPTLDSTSNVPYTSVPRAAGGTPEDEGTTPQGNDDTSRSGTTDDTAGSGSSAPSLSDDSGAARTSLSSDAGTPTSSTPTLSSPAATATQSTPTASTPQNAGGMQGMTPTGGQPNTANAANKGGSKSALPNLTSYDRDRKKRQQEEKEDRERAQQQLDGAVAVPVALPGGAESPTARGVTTAAQTSGAGTTAPTALSSNGTNPQQAGTNPNGPNPRGGMGGGMMGGMGSGMGMGGGQVKPRDQTPAGVQDRGLLGYQSVQDSVQGGSIGRDSSNADRFTDWSGSIELLDDKGKDKKDTA